MDNRSIVKILQEAALFLEHRFEPTALKLVEINSRTYTRDQFHEFKRDLLEAGQKTRILFLEQRVQRLYLNDFLQSADSPVLLFMDKGSQLVPVLVFNEKKTQRMIRIDGDLHTPFDGNPEHFFPYPEDSVIAFHLYPYESLVSEYMHEGEEMATTLNPVRRFFKLLSTERKNIIYILVYSVFIGLTGLILPVGIQNTVQLISGGVFFSTIYVLIGVVILGILLTGVLQIIQITLVEYIQKKIFTKAALEFAFRIPRIKVESILNNHAPELVNRFFDVQTIQKGLPKFLIDLLSSAIQILFGLILLSLYHPFFVFFSIVLVVLLLLIFYFTGPRALRSSIDESKYKYKVAHWLEELARSNISFKLAGNTDLPISKTDQNVSNYLKHRKTHFNILITQFSFIVVFKTAVTASLLILGTILVIERQISLGQFVAAEVVIILILNSVEKVIMYMDVIYDLFTAVDKIAHVTDLPLEKPGGLYFPALQKSTGYSLDIKSLNYRYPGTTEYVLKDLSLHVAAGEKICISGPGNAGKTTLTNLISGVQIDYEGIIMLNNYSLRDLDLRNLRDRMAKNISPEDIFDGTILENITLGNPQRTVEDAMHVLRKIKLDEEIYQLPDGMNTHLVSGGKGFSSSFIQKLILARCLVKRPALLILNDYFVGLKRKQKLELLEAIMGEENPFTLIAVSNDPLIMAACDRVVILNAGRIEAVGTYEELLKVDKISSYID